MKVRIERRGFSIDIVSFLTTSWEQSHRRAVEHLPDIGFQVSGFLQREFDGLRQVKQNANAPTPSMVSMETGAIYETISIAFYLLKNVHAAIASNMMAMTHKDESLIPVFLAMRNILS
jgi:hypothetical protein